MSINLKDIKVSPMGLEDLNQVCEIEQMSFKSPWSQSAYEREIKENKLAFYLVAKYQDRIIGYIGSWIVVNELHITNFAVKPEYRCQGIGSLLLSHLLKQAYLKGLESVTLEVRVSNIPAQKIYNKFGFKIVGTRRKYYENKEDAVLMSLEITPSVAED